MDNLNQAGKAFKKTQQKGKYTQSAYERNFPFIERARDSIDCNHPFMMEVPVVDGQKTRITLIFMEPYYPNPCGGIG